MNASDAAGDVVRYDGMAGVELAAALELPNVVVFDAVASTLDVAHALAGRGAPAGTLILADTQTAGRGRMGRSWTSESGAGIWLTLIERPAAEDLVSVLSLRIALCLARVLDDFADVPIEVKWPNDLYVAERKLAGILVETRWRAGRLDWLAAGIGINLRPPSGLNAAALRAGSSRLEVLRAAVPAIREALGMRGRLDADERREFQRRDLSLGRRCREPAIGVVAGIDATGALLLDTATGRVAFHAGSLVFDDANVPTAGGSA
jgi:BirA family biotin operon repressor/biotin-[acetyl-CoA-carboxylase] ligase